MISILLMLIAQSYQIFINLDWTDKKNLNNYTVIRHSGNCVSSGVTIGNNIAKVSIVDTLLQSGVYCYEVIGTGKNSAGATITARGTMVVGVPESPLNQTIPVGVIVQ